MLIAIMAYGQDDSAPAYFSDYDCKVDGVMYRLSGTEATVTHGGIVSIGGHGVHEPLIQDFYSGNVVIPEEFTYNGITYYVTAIGEEAFYYCANVTSVTIPSSIKSIAPNAFLGCSGLTAVTLNSNDIVSKSYTHSSNIKNIFGNQVKEYIIGKEVTSIGAYAFDGCSGLTSVTIPNSVTSIGRSAFRDCI